MQDGRIVPSRVVGEAGCAVRDVAGEGRQESGNGTEKCS